MLDIPPAVQSNGKTAAAVAKALTSAAPSSKSAGKKSPKVKVRTVEDVEREIEKAEAHVKAVEDELADAALLADAAQLTRLATDYEQAGVHVEELLAEWERLAEM